MRIYKDGISKSIDSSEFGYYQRQGWVKVEAKEPVTVEEIKVETTTPNIDEEEIIVKPKNKNKNK